MATWQVLEHETTHYIKIVVTRDGVIQEGFDESNVTKGSITLTAAEYVMDHMEDDDILIIGKNLVS